MSDTRLTFCREKKNHKRKTFHHKLAVSSRGRETVDQSGTCLGTTPVERRPHVSSREEEKSKVQPKPDKNPLWLFRVTPTLVGVIGRKPALAGEHRAP